MRRECVFGAFWGGLGAQKGALSKLSASILGAIFDQKSKKRHPKRHLKIDAEKVSKNDEKRLQNDAKMDAIFMFFHTFSKRAKSHETIVFTIENVVLGMQKRIKNQSKIYLKSMLEKVMQK